MVNISHICGAIPMNLFHNNFLRKILTFLFFINLIYPSFCKVFTCDIDICDTRDFQFCNVQDKRCNYCGPQHCVIGLKECEEYCQSRKTSTPATFSKTTTTPVSFSHSVSPPYVQFNLYELWWKIPLVVGVVVILIFVVDNHRRLHCNKKAGGGYKVDGNVAEKKQLLNHSEDSGLDQSPDGSNTAVHAQQDKPHENIELNNLTRERANQLQDQRYDHGQAKLIPGTNRSINPQRPINEQCQPHTSPEFCTESNKLYNDDPNGLSIHKNGKLLYNFSGISENDETNLKHTI
ncbi:hypothetical protein SNE40_005255 [Patella caerulea]|uniref:Uncharacterized protein n=1 Tax=Patella caerulea TaxID=87958 RepID=A0AAN8K0I0_PATCE